MISSKLHQISKEFSDLVLGPLPIEDNLNFEPETNISQSGSISHALEFLADTELRRGQIVEINGSEPEDIERFLEMLVSQKNAEDKTLALLGAEKSRWQSVELGASVIVMSSEKAAQILFAARELAQSNAIEIIVIQEILLKTDSLAGGLIRKSWVVDELRKLKALIYETNAVLVLVNPNTSERRLVESELYTICSHQIELRRYE